ncbi:MAG: enoyl-CoA hydratase/isomerase family protein [Gammaproteobacteria bacterium]|nr:enoyl-CoA hydratase/isomerase family protein [Gammaproteobacteria bacterium]MBQ0840620.1 enoyl-CoA hydratase/isomerase family protein [Gammaproteobacteria bacterium]
MSDKAAWYARLSDKTLNGIADKNAPHHALIGQIVFNRPDNRNSLTPEMLAALQEAIAAAKADTQIRCLIITGSGKTFCAGGDFKGGAENSAIPFTQQGLIDTYSTCMELLNISVPVIGALNGHAIGGGFGVALLSDIRVANSEALYGANFARLGMHSGMSLSYILPRLIGLAKANELMFTGRRFSGSEGEKIGLFNYALAADQVWPKALALAKEIAACAPNAVQLMKQSIIKNLDWDPQAKLADEALHQSSSFDSNDAREGIAAMMAKREPVFNGT